MCGDPPRDLPLPPQRMLTHRVRPLAHPLCEVWGPLGPCLAFSSIPTLCLYGSKVGDAVGSGGVWMVEGTGRILLDCARRSPAHRSRGWCWKKGGPVGFCSMNAVSNCGAKAVLLVWV